MIKLVKVLGNEKQEEYSKILYELGIMQIDDSFMIYKDNIEVPVGILEYRVINNYEAFVEYIHVLEQYRLNGIARDVVELLAQEYDLSGWSKADAVGFWKKVGAEFGESIETEDDLNYYLESGECIPFEVF